MPWGVAAAAVSAYGAVSASKNNKDASKSAQKSYDQSYYNNLQNMQPYLTAGTNALNQLTQLSNGDYSSFKESPDYQFTQQQGLQALDRSAAAKGSLYSGGQSADIVNYASGLASQQYGNYRNNLLQLANMGQSSASALAGVNSTYANQSASTAYNNASNSNSLTGLLTGIGSNLLTNYATTGRTSAYGDISGQANSITQANNNNLLYKLGLG